MQFSRKMILGVALILVMIGATYAILQVSKTVNTNGTIVTSTVFDIVVYSPDHVTVLTSINFGTLYQGDSGRRFPNTAGEYYLNNVGDQSVWISHSWTPVNGITFKLYVRRGDSTSSSLLAQGSLTSFALLTPATTFPNSDWMGFYIILDIAATAPVGAFTSTLTFNAHDSSTS